MNTRIVYMLRDADNYKATNEIVLAGSLTDAEKDEIVSLLDPNADGFIPVQVWMRDLHDDLARWNGGELTEQDQPWYEFTRDDIEDTDDAPTHTAMTAQQLLAAFRAVGGHWDEKAEMQRLGLS